MLLAKLELNGCEGDFQTIYGKILWKVTTKEKLISLRFDGIRDGMNSLILKRSIHVNIVYRFADLKALI